MSPTHRLARIPLRLAGLCLAAAALAAVSLALMYRGYDNMATGQQQRLPPQGSFRPQQVIGSQPPIRDAPVLAAEQVTREVTDQELVLGVELNGAARAYPINMLTGPTREIINDTLGDTAIAATW